MNSLFPSEIISSIFSYLDLKDLSRVECTCKKLQSFSLAEMERRIMKTQDRWGILVKIHLGEIKAQPVRFDPVDKKAYFSILMDPVNIKTMFDHNRPIHCSLTRKDNPEYDTNGFTMTIEKGMSEGKTIQMDVQNELCKVQAELTRLPTPPPSPQLDEKNYFKQPLDIVAPLAPAPLAYTLQITELCLPLSTLA